MWLETKIYLALSQSEGSWEKFSPTVYPWTPVKSFSSLCLPTNLPPPPKAKISVLARSVTSDFLLPFVILSPHGSPLLLPPGQSIFFHKQYLENKEKEVLEKLLMKTACTGNGSLNSIRNIVYFIKNENQQREDDNDAPDWFVYKAEGNHCCGKRTFVTSYMMFWNWKHTRAEDFDFSTNATRKAAYHQLTMWKYGRLGRGNRKPNPVCIVRMIREAYPSPTNEYMGYKES